MAERPMPPEARREAEKRGNYSLEANEQFLGFERVNVTEFDESLPWKPAKTVEVIQADGSKVEDLEASTPFFTFKDANGKEIVVSAEAAGHIDQLHIKGEDVGSKFDEPSLEALFQDMAVQLPEGLADRPGIFTLDVEMGKNMGMEGIASTEELVASGRLSQVDIDAAQSVREEVQRLNREGTEEERLAFAEKYAEEHPDAGVQFTAAREDKVLLPTVKAPKQPTTKLFVMMGPNPAGDKKALYTIAPGRDMPRHPVPGQYTDREGAFDEAGYQEAEQKWFDTVMLTGE